MSLRNIKWVWADIGYHPRRKIWFVDLHNEQGSVQIFYANSIIIDRVPSIQYQWSETGRIFWHVRDIEFDDEGNLVVHSLSIMMQKEKIPSSYSYLAYAFSLQTSKGFVEFYDKNNELLTTLTHKWIVIEDLERRTIGKYPNIRITAKKTDIKEIIATKSTIIIIGNR
jgi:hypothetical protein